MAKEVLKLKVKKFWWLIPTFVEVTDEKLVWRYFASPLPCPPSRSGQGYQNKNTWHKHHSPSWYWSISQLFNEIESSLITTNSGITPYIKQMSKLLLVLFSLHRNIIFHTSKIISALGNCRGFCRSKNVF